MRKRKPEKTRKQIARHNRNLQDAAMSIFINKMKYKAAWCNVEIEYTERFQPTTSICNVCGYVLGYPLDPSIKEWDCPNCNTHLDRDINAALVMDKRCEGNLPVCDKEPGSLNTEKVA